MGVGKRIRVERWDGEIVEARRQGLGGGLNGCGDYEIFSSTMIAYSSLAVAADSRNMDQSSYKAARKLTSSVPSVPPSHRILSQITRYSFTPTVLSTNQHPPFIFDFHRPT